MPVGGNGLVLLGRRKEKSPVLLKDRPVIIERLLNAFTAWYNVSPGDLDSGLPLKALCEHNSRSEKYAMSKKAKLWAVEINDFLYLFSMPVLGISQMEECIAFSIENALPRVKPHKEHMYSFITTIFIADEADDEALKAISRRKFNKSYRWGFYGTSPLKTAAFDIKRETVATNNMGRNLCKQIKSICKE